MKKSTYLAILTILWCLYAVQAVAAPLRTFITDFKVSSTETTTDLPTLLQRMLASRLSADLVQQVDAKNKTELVISGSYTSFGKMFSLDLALQNTSNGNLISLFEQGSGQDDIIPAMGRLALKTNAALSTHHTVVQPSTVVPSPAAVPAVVIPPTATSLSREPAGGYVIHSQATIPNNDLTTWESAPLDGAHTSLAVGQLRTTGERELFTISHNAVTLFLKGAELTKKDSVTIALPAQLLAVDAADLDRDGRTELFITIMDRNKLASRIYSVEGDTLKLAAANLPWFFRGIGLTSQNRTIYVQKLGLRGEFLDGVAELKKNGARFTAGAPLTLPRFGTIFTFNKLQDAKGNSLFVVLDQDGYLVVYTTKGEEIWKSADKFGGSETSFVHSSFTHFRSTREKDHPSFLEQRMTVLPDGTLLVPVNSGGFGLGNNRNYGKHAIYAFKWTGSMLKEVWHTQQAPSYLADYAYLADQKSLLLLEVIQKAGLNKKGKSILSVKKIE